MNATAPAPRLHFTDLFNAAGALTLARIPLAFVTAFVMHDHFWFVAVFVLAMGSDVLDGPVARWTGKGSRAGAIADGWADKIFLINYAWSMEMMGYAEGWHLWLWFLREIIQAATIPLVALDYAYQRKPFPQPLPEGRLATLCIAVGMMAGLAGLEPARDLLTLIGGGMGAVAGLRYVARDQPWTRIRRWLARG
ncbi:MAG: CDP-alcohol phosphatidyltransferase family protein [Myxococcota bacterium]|nr:CDP-alcohol phosphatidyltransferase family protein [Myxococcota bacterium]